MSQPAHTPGPWHRNIKPASTYCTVWSGRNTHVAYVTGQGKLDEKEIEANLQLIATSPELLASGKELLNAALELLDTEWAKATCTDETLIDHIRNLHECSYDMKQAIAKAERDES